MGMSNIAKILLPPEEKVFFNLFEQSAETCSEAAKLFFEISHKNLNEERLIHAKTLKHKGANLAKESTNQLNKTFITPIDREDIQLIASLLHKITKRIIRGCLNLRVYRLNQHTELMKHQAETLVKATDELKKTISYLRKISMIKEINDSNQRMYEIENHGDEILFNAMDELFSGKYDALTVIKLRDIYRSIEGALDYCFNVSDTIVNIALKHG